MKLIYFIFLLFAFHAVQGQSRKVNENELYLLKYYEQEEFEKVVDKADSLLKLKSISNVARIYQIKADALYFLNDVEASLQNYLLTIDNLEEYPLDTTHTLEAYSHTGFCYVYLGKNVEALPYYEKALAYALSANDSAEIPTQASNIGNIYARLNNLPKARKYYEQSYAISFARKDSVALAYDLMDLGALMFRMGDYDEAISFYLQGIKVHKTKSGNHNTHILRLNKLAEAYLKNNKIDSADFYISKAINQALNIEDSLSVHKSWLVKSEIYLANEKYDSAFLLANLCRDYFEGEIFSRYEISANKTLVQSKMLSGQSRASLIILNEFIPRLEMNKEIEALSKFLSLRSQVLEELNRPIEALADLRLSQVYSDSLRLSKRENTILSLSKLYDTRDKEQKIELLESKAALQEAQAKSDRRFRLILIFAVLLLLSLAGLLYHRNHIKKKNADLLKDRNQALSDLNHTKDQLFAIVSHDLRNPVSAFRNMTEALETNYKMLEEEKVVSYLKKMKLNASEIENQLNDLLAWAAQEIGKQKIEREHLPVKPMVENVFNLLRPIAEIKGIKLDYQLEDHVVLKTHPELFKTVIRNLVNNAIKFTEKGGLVKLIAITEQGNIIFKIEDNGVGIAADQLKLLFSDQKMKAKEGTGMGMGLSLTKEIMERLDGEIDVQSTLNKGTTFTLKFAA